MGTSCRVSGAFRLGKTQHPRKDPGETTLADATPAWAPRPQMARRVRRQCGQGSMTQDQAGRGAGTYWATAWAVARPGFLLLRVRRDRGLGGQEG